MQQLRIFETILREFLKSFLLHIQLWLDVLDLQVGVDELEFLVILVLSLFFFSRNIDMEDR